MHLRRPSLPLTVIFPYLYVCTGPPPSVPFHPLSLAFRPHLTFTIFIHLTLATLTPRPLHLPHTWEPLDISLTSYYLPLPLHFPSSYTIAILPPPFLSLLLSLPLSLLPSVPPACHRGEGKREGAPGGKEVKKIKTGLGKTH